MEIKYRPQGVCSQMMEIEVEDGVITKIEILGGCNGNLQGISALCVGRPVKEVIDRLSGIRCGNKHTSCPDQLATALLQAL